MQIVLLVAYSYHPSTKVNCPCFALFMKFRRSLEK